MKSSPFLLSLLNLLMIFYPLSVMAQEAGQPVPKPEGGEGIGQYEKTVQSNPRDADGWYNLGNSYFKAARVQDAIQAYRKAVGVKSDYGEAWCNLGLALAKSGQMDEALSALGKAVKIKAGDSATWFNFGTVREKVGRFQEAAEAYEKAVALDPNNADAGYNLAILQLQFGKGAPAALYGRAYLKLKGWRDAGAAYMVLVCHFGDRQAKEDAAAREILAEAVQKCDPAAWPFSILRFLNREMEAAELLKAADGKDKMTEARTYLGLTAMLDGQKDSAIEYFRWVRDEGDKNLFEHRFAAARLRELETAASSPWEYGKHRTR